ncbi:hypothetical protein HYV10_03380 [Candidatus Dependentiae bacterium]|nr:hypothetical protein [Candidatus Dependentiae bacterium]
MLDIFLSAIFFAVTFFVPQLSLVTMMIFLMPLYKIGNEKKLLKGFIWGLIVFGVHWSWIIMLFKKELLYSTGIVLWILITIWCSLFSALWIYFFKNHRTISTILFFVFIKQGILLPLGKLEGLPLLNPLVLLAQYPICLKPLYYISDIGMFTIIFGLQNWIANKNNILQSFYILLLCLLTLIAQQYLVEKKYIINGATIITPWWYQQKKGAMFEGYRLAHDIGKQSTATTQIIITPESTFCFDVNEFLHFISVWCDSSQNIPILLSAYTVSGGNPHNSLLLLHNNTLVRKYLKKHKMPFMERTVWFEYFLKSPILSFDFLSDASVAQFQNDLIGISGKIYQLFVCSEFFWEVKKIWGYPILFLWNDIWLSSDYIKKIALLFISYFEQKYHVPVYYAATSGMKNIC